MKNKTTTLVMGMLILGIIMLSFASATDDYRACFNKGDRYTYCGTFQAKVALHQSACGPLFCTCMSTQCDGVCVKSYNEADKCYVPGNSLVCLGLTPDCSNSNTGENISADSTPPVLKILSPLNGTISKSTKLFLNFSLNEVATVYYKDVNKNTNTWTKVCDNCVVGNPSYKQLRTFSQGENNLMFKAVDLGNNVAYASAKFTVDSTAPRIYTTLPRANTFADGDFEVQFKEANPKRVTLTYGTDKVNVDLSKCTITPSKETCDTTVSLDKYNGQKILYFYEVEDIAGNIYKSKPLNVSVDTKAPVVNNPSSFFKVNGHYVDFNISITEPNLDKVVFTRTNSQITTKTTLCTRLVNGYCTKHQSFTKGTYSLSIQITDEAGHAIAIPASFTII